MIFRLFINDTLVANPENWKSFKIQYTRNEELKGLFVKYANDIRLAGDGYNLVNNAITYNGICTVLSVRVESRCNEYDNWGIIFTGVIRCKDVKFEQIGQECYAIVDFEQNNPSATLSENADVRVSLFSDESINKVEPIAFDVHEVYERFAPLTGISIPENTAPWLRNNPQGYLCKTVIDQMLSYLTDGALRLRSDIFDLAPSDDYWNIALTNDLLDIDDVVYCTITDFFNNQVTASFIATGNRTNDLVRWANAVIYASQLMGSCPDPNDAFRTGTERFMKPFGIAEATPTANTALLLRAYSPIQSVTTAVIGTGSITLTVTHPISYTRGLKGLHVIKGQEFWQIFGSAPIEMFFSFEDLMKTLNAAFNLQYQFEYDSDEDQWYLRLEPMEYFFSTSGSAFNFTNVPDLEKSFDEKRIRTGLKLGANYNEDDWAMSGLYSLTNPTTGQFINQFFFEDTENTFESNDFGECAQGVYEVLYDTQYTFGQAGQINQMTLPNGWSISNYNDIAAKVFFMDTKFNPLSGNHEFRKFNFQRSEVVGGVYTLVNYYVYNANYTVWQFLQWHYFGLASPVSVRPKIISQQLNKLGTIYSGSSSVGAKQPLTNLPNNNFLQRYKFRYPINPTDFANIGQTAKVKLEGVEAYLLDIEYTLYNGMANIELMVNL